MWFENPASAGIRFFEGKGKYYSILEAQTKGFVGWFTAYRKHLYKADFEIFNGEKRVRTTRFDRKVIAVKTVEETSYRLDYRLRKHFWVKRPDGEVLEDKSQEILARIYFDDFLAGFYNCRNNIYENLLKGFQFEIHTIPEKVHDTISFQIINGEDGKTTRQKEGGKFSNEFLLNVIIPKEILKQNPERFYFGLPNIISLWKPRSKITYYSGTCTRNSIGVFITVQKNTHGLFRSPLTD